ncbi:MAG TPA: hypothetical protein VIL26_04310 [Clostridia bacterium]
MKDEYKFIPPKEIFRMVRHDKIINYYKGVYNGNRLFQTSKGSEHKSKSGEKQQDG